jgi:DNA-binding response OmpR family regulator
MPKKILVADDDAVLVAAISSRLRQQNYEVVNAFDAIQVMSGALSTKPDLIVLDIKMPAGTGKGALESLKKSTKTFSIPVIVMTAYPNDELRQFAIEQGAVDFLEKPFQMDALLASIEKILGKDK